MKKLNELNVIELNKDEMKHIHGGYFTRGSYNKYGVDYDVEYWTNTEIGRAQSSTTPCVDVMGWEELDQPYGSPPGQ